MIILQDQQKIEIGRVDLYRHPFVTVNCMRHMHMCEVCIGIHTGSSLTFSKNSCADNIFSYLVIGSALLADSSSSKGSEAVVQLDSNFHRHSSHDFLRLGGSGHLFRSQPCLGLFRAVCTVWPLINPLESRAQALRSRCLCLAGPLHDPRDL